MKKSYITYLLLSFLLTSFSYSQTYRDSLVKTITRNIPKDLTTYNKLKTDLRELENIEGKPNPELLYSNIQTMYRMEDLDYFKATLELLTKRYGYNISYLKGSENYYKAIMHGELAEWFKKMYIKNHSEWLSENLDKQIDIYRLNTLFEKDQLVNKALGEIYNKLNLSDEQEKIRYKILGGFFYENAEVIESVAKKIESMPRGNSFALIQNAYGIVEIHSLQNDHTYEKLWTTFYPYYKNSYINKDISSTPFRNIDSNLYIHEGKQIFNLIRIEDVPKDWRRNANDTEIPLKDELETKKMRKELGWY